MTSTERTGLSLAGVLTADVLVSSLAQLIAALIGKAAGSPWYSFLYLTLLSLVVVLPAWVLWQPVIWSFRNPLRRHLGPFVMIGILWGPAVTYGIRLGTLRQYPVPRFQPDILDGIASAVSTLATLFYLLLLKHFSTKRILSD